MPFSCDIIYRHIYFNQAKITIVKNIFLYLQCGHFVIHRQLAINKYLFKMLVKDTSCIILEFTGMKGLIVKIHQ